MAKKKDFYSWKKILETQSTYLMAIGGRDIGKSYDAKLTVVKECFLNNRKFGLVRRWKEDLKQNLVEQYFKDTPIELITGGKYKEVRCWQGKLYLGNINENGEWEKEKMLIGYCFPLTSEQHFKSTMYPDLDWIIFEEFISNTFYLPDEPKKLDSLISTIARDREIKVLLVGNSISRMCPYFGYWSLDKTLAQKQGTIEIYTFKHKSENTDEVLTVKVAVEMCGNKIDQKMFFGKSRSMTVNGKWQSDEHPTLTKKRSDYETLYEMFVFYQGVKYKCYLLKDNNNYIWFVEPFTEKFKNTDNTRIIGDIYNESILATTSFTPLTPQESKAFNLFKLGKVAFSDNLTGTEFTKLLETL